MGLALTSCALLEKVTANKLLVVTWLKMPSFDQEPFRSLPELGVVTVNAVFIDTSKPPPKPIQGGFAAFFGAGRKVDLIETPVPGVYAQTSAGEPSLIYDDTATRRFGFKACLINRNGCIGQEYSIGRILAAPSVEREKLTLTPQPTASELPGFSGQWALNQSLTVKFPQPEGDVSYRPILMVFGPTGKADKPFGQIYSTLPASPDKYFDFLNSEVKLELTIPGEVFAAQGPYAVMAATARVNMDTSGLFAGSGALAGAANGFLLEIPIEIPVGLPTLP